MDTKKKIIAAALAISLTAGSVLAATGLSVSGAIRKYKAGNYTGCLQDMQTIAKKDPSNAVAHYYIGTSYLKIGMKTEAQKAFERVIDINSVPQLTSLALQANYCISSKASSCKYMTLTSSQINELKQNPTAFYEKLKSGEKLPEVQQESSDIEELIKGRYPSNVHPDALRVIEEERLLREQENVNKSENEDKTVKIASAKPSEKEIVQALETLSEAGFTLQAPVKEESESEMRKAQAETMKRVVEMYRPQMMMPDMAMMNGSNQNNGMNMMNYMMLMQQGEGKTKITPEMAQIMMMNQMSGGLGLGTDGSNMFGF